MQFSIKFEKNVPKRLAPFFVDGREINYEEMEELTGLSMKRIKSIKARSSNSKDFDTIIKDDMYKNTNNLPPQTVVYRRGDKEYCSLFLVELTGVDRTRACTVLHKWTQGKIEWEDVINISPGEHIQRNTTSTLSKIKLSPRKKPKDIPVGSWERQFLKEV